MYDRSLMRAERVPIETHQQALRIHAFIEQSLPDLTLSPAMVAAAHHLSLPSCMRPLTA